MNKLRAYPNNNLSKRLIGQNTNWFPNGSSLSSLISGNVGVSTYGIKPDNAPSENIAGGFGYGTLFVVGGRGDEGYGYGYAIYSGSNAAGSRVFATYDNKDSGWSERVSKSDLINLFFSTRTTSDLLYVSSDFSFGTTLTNSSTKNVPASDKNGIALTLGNSDVSNCIVVWIPLGRKPDGIYINTFIKSNNIWFGWQKIQLIDV